MTNYDQPSDPSPRSVYDETPPTCDPEEYFAQSVIERFNHMDKTIETYRADISRLRQEVYELRKSLEAYAAMEGN